MVRVKCCIPTCDNDTFRRHRFPFPNKYPETFEIWKSIISDCNHKLKLLPNKQIYKCYRICEKHFESKYILPAVPFERRRNLIVGAIPTLLLSPSPVTDDETIDLIKARIHLDHKFSKKSGNIEAWNEIAKKLKCEPNPGRLSKKWCNILDIYKKCLNGEINADDWSYFDQMHSHVNLMGFHIDFDEPKQTSKEPKKTTEDSKSTYEDSLITDEDPIKTIEVPIKTSENQENVTSINEKQRHGHAKDKMDMDMPWNDKNENMLIDLLRNREHIYNRNHPNYKTYDVIKECAAIANLFQPPKTSKEIMDKITSIRNDLAKLRNMIQSNDSNLEFPRFFKKCKFMYSALFGEIPSHFLKRKFEDIESVELSDSDITEEKPNCFKKIKLNELEKLLKNIQYDSGNIDCSGHETETETTLNSSDLILFKTLTKKENINILRRIICFIQDKSFLWDSQHPMYDDFEYSKIILEEFGETFDPPLTVHLIQYGISYLRKTFFKSLKQGKKWHLFNDCKFFLTYEKNILKNFPNKHFDHKMNLHKIIKFIEDKPFLYDIEHPKYDNIKFKTTFLTSLGETLNPPLSSSSLITYINDLRTLFYKNLNKINNQTTWPWWLDCCRFFLNEDKNNSIELEDESDQEIKITEVDNNNDIQNSMDDSFSNNNENVKEIGIQCNLYGELLKEKIKIIKFKKCSCYKEILNIIDSFNPIDTNLELLKFKTAKNLSMENQLIDNEDSILKIENNLDGGSVYNEELDLSKEENEKINIEENEKINIEENENINIEENTKRKIEENEKIIKEDNEVKWSDFENVSDDSSDYGLTEIPFPEKKKKKKFLNHVTLYECSICKKEFKSHHLFDLHYTKFHAERSQLCSVCGRKFSNFHSLQWHENHCNPNDYPYCHDCKHSFKSRINYYDHFNSKHNKTLSPYICVCKGTFKKYTNLVSHLNQKHCGTLAMCTIPDYTTKEFIATFLEKKIDKEDNTITNKTEVKKLKYWCRICNRNFFNNRQYVLHFGQDEYHKIKEKEWLKEFCIENGFHCELCDKNLPELIDLLEHRVKYHHKRSLDDFIKKFEYLPKDEEGETILIRQPTDISKIYSNCYICKRKFFMQDFKLHFKQSEHLFFEKNILDKNNISIINCIDCSKDFYSLYDYFEHRNSEHNEWPTNSIIKSFVDEKNNRMSDYLQSKIHCKVIYKCSACNYFTQYKSVYIDHMLYHCREKIIHCSCGKKFISPMYFGHHRNKRRCKKEGTILPKFLIDSSCYVNKTIT